MNTKKFSEALGEVNEKYIEKAIVYNENNGSTFHAKRRLPIALVAAIVAIILMGAGVVAVIYGDLWVQNPSKDPIKSVHSAIENQVGKDYTIKVKIVSVEIDQEETGQAMEHLIKSTIAEWRGWSNEYLAEHFVAVRAVYYAEYDHEKTTRNDGNVVQYFYLTEDVKTGEWTIVDNSGNMNWSDNAESQEASDFEIFSIKKQLFSYLSRRFTEAYSPHYDGLHYKMKDYKEVLHDDEVKVTFLWTMYHLGKGWDIASDEGKEQESNLYLKATATVNQDGLLDLTTITVLADTSDNGSSNFNMPIEDLFPTT